MDSKSAIKPSFYREFTTEVEEQVKAPVEVGEDQKALSYITHFKGWEILKETKDRLERYLDQLVSEAMAGGLSMEEIGQRTMVKEMSKFVLNSLIEKAENARRETDK